MKLNEEMKRSQSRAVKMGLSAILSYVSTGIDMLTGIVITPWIISTLGASQYSLYTLACSLIATFTIDFGMSRAVTRYMSKYVAENNTTEIPKFLGIISKIYLAITLVVMIALVVVYLFIENIYVQLTPDEMYVFKAVYIIAAGFSVVSFPFMQLNGILVANEEFVFIKKLSILEQVVKYVFISIALFLGGGIYSVVAGTSLVAIFSILLKLIYIRRANLASVRWKYWDNSQAKEITSFSIWITVISITERFGLNLAPTILGIVSGSTAIAIFGVARTIEAYASTICSAISQFFLPKVSEVLFGENAKQDDLTKLLIRTGRIMFLLCGLVFVGFVCTGRDFLSAWINDSIYADSYLCVVVLVISILLFYPQEVADNALVAMNKVKVKAYSHITAAIVKIVLMLAFGKLWGAMGVCVGISAGNLVRMLQIDVYYHRSHFVDLKLFIREVYIRLGVLVAVTLIGGVLICRMITFFDGWLSFALKACIVLVLYATLAWKMFMNKYEKKLTKELIHALTNRRN